MASWASIHIKTSNLQKVKDFIKKHFNFETEVSGAFPDDYHKSFLFSSNEPSLAAIGKTQDEWLTIRYNVLGLQDDWSELLSKEFDTTAICIVAQSSSDCYSFLMFNKGEKIRVRTSGEGVNENWGSPLEIEEELEEAGFNFYTIEEWCQSLGLQIQSDYSIVEWITLRIDNNERTIDDFVQKFLIKRKPWWKFW